MLIQAETLFCIFYQNPRDLLQEQAAQELTARDWRWHKVLRQWLQKDNHSAGGNASAGGSGSTSLPIIDLTNGTPIGVNLQELPIRSTIIPVSICAVDSDHVQRHPAQR